MRIFPRFKRPSLKPLVRRLRQARRHLTIARIVLAVELLLFGSLLWWLATGSRAAWLDQSGPRADALALSAALLLCGLLHGLAQRYLIPALEQRFSPKPYDERRMLFDLSQEARGAESIEQLYQSIIQKIGAALETERVAIFARDEESGAYFSRLSEPPLMLAREAFVITRLRHLTVPLVLEPAEFDAWMRALDGAPATVRNARLQEREVLESVQARLLLPIRTKDQLSGVLALGPRRGAHQYTHADKEVLMTVAAQLALVLENSRLLERIVAEEKLRRELALAAQVQQRLLPTEPPISGTLELAGVCHPARGVGGDYYDFLPFDNQQIGIAIADVAGKGMAAALLMSTVQASLRSQALMHNDATPPSHTLARLVASMNLLLCRSTQGSNYVTFFYAQFDEQTRQLTYVNAGHNPPFLLRKEPTAERWVSLSTGGLFIGAFDHLQYEEETLDLRSGDVLVAYTDGVTEALDVAGEEFGEERLQAVLKESAHLPAQGIREHVSEQVREWCAGAPQYDDLTFLVMKVK
jgi:phosphoserine phosphatase RsbU/P